MTNGDCSSATPTCSGAFSATALASGYATGFCTKACTTSAQCGSGGNLLRQSLYAIRCTPGGLECPMWGAGCQVVDAQGDLGCGPACLPTGATPPLGEPPCPTSMACVPESGFCGGPTPSATAASDGAPCTQNTDCKSQICYPEIDTQGVFGPPGPTGFIQGYCISGSLLLPQSAAVMNTPIPQADCPPGSAPLFASPPNTNPGDIGPCFTACTSNAGCRGGYACTDPATGGAVGSFFSNGLCLPSDCSMSSGNACPTGYSCVVTPASDAGPASGRCTAGASDAGADASAGVAVSTPMLWRAARIPPTVRVAPLVTDLVRRLVRAAR